MIVHAVQDLEKEVFIRYRPDGSDLCRLTAKPKSFFNLIKEALFGVDRALVAHDDFDSQLMLDCFPESAKSFGLTICLVKTEVLHQPAPGGNNTAPVIAIDCTQLDNVESFKYLGSTMSQDGSPDREFNA